MALQPCSDGHDEVWWNDDDFNACPACAYGEARYDAGEESGREYAEENHECDHSECIDSYDVRQIRDDAEMLVEALAKLESIDPFLWELVNAPVVDHECDTAGDVLRGLARDLHDIHRKLNDLA